MDIVHAAPLFFHSDVIKGCESDQFAVKLLHRDPQHMLCCAFSVGNYVSAVKFEDMAGYKTLLCFVALGQWLIGI